MTASRTAQFGFLVGLMVTGFLPLPIASAQDKRAVDRLNGRWKRQAKIGEPFSYPPLIWHAVGDRDWGWIEPGLSYSRQGSVTCEAAFHVHEVLSETEAIMKVAILQHTDQMLPGGIEATKESGRANLLFLFQAFDFRGVAVNEVLEWSGAVMVSGTHTVVRADGSEVQLIGVQPTTPPPLPTHAAELGIGLRTWHDVTGKHSIRAGFHSVNHDKVVLVKPGGDRIEVPIDRLSIADQGKVAERTAVRSAPRTVARRSATRHYTSQRSLPGESFSDGLRRTIHNQAVTQMNYSMRRDLNSAFSKARSVQHSLNMMKQTMQSRWNARRTNH